MSSLLQAFGILPTRDNDAAQKATDAATSAYAQQGNEARGNLYGDIGYGNQLANQNYYGNAQQVYGQQQQALNSLQAQANGTAASAAQGQMQLGLGAANQQAQAAALSQQGGVMPGLTQRNMLMAQAANSQNVLGQSAVLRAQEQMQNTQAYNQALANVQNQQQQQGQLLYRQGQDNLQNRIGLHQGIFNDGQTATGNAYNASMTNINGQAAANQAQAAAIGKTLGGVAQAAVTA